MSDFKPGLEGVIAFETEIAEPDKEGGALRYRGVDIEDLDRPGVVRQRVGAAGRRQVRPRPAAGRAVPGAGALRRHPGRRAVARSPMLAPYWGLGQLLDIDDEQAREDLARVVGDRAVVRRPVRPRPRPAGGAAEGDRQGRRRSSSGS